MTNVYICAFCANTVGAMGSRGHDEGTVNALGIANIASPLGKSSFRAFR